MDVGDFIQYLPPLFEGGYTNSRRYIHAVICLFLLVKIQPEYKGITYKEFIDKFEEWIKITGYDNPCLCYQKGAKKEGQIKIPNLSTFADNWINEYNVRGLLKDFKTEVTKHIAENTYGDIVLNIPNFIDKETATFDKAHIKQHILLDDLSDDGKKPYQIKAYQETKTSAKNNIQDDALFLQDYLAAIHQQNNQGEVYNPNHDRIIDRYRAMEEEWEED